MKKIILSITLLGIMSPVIGAICVSKNTVDDYLDMATLYQNSHKYYKALEYINMIEPYDEYNPQIKYQKIALLKSIDDYTLAGYNLNKLIDLNTYYVCSDLAQDIYDKEHKKICSSHTNAVLD